MRIILHLKLTEMQKLNRIAVKVTFEVVLLDVDIPEKAKEQILARAEENGIIKTESTMWPDAIEWLCANIAERDSLGHKYEIIQVY